MNCHTFLCHVIAMPRNVELKARVADGDLAELERKTAALATGKGVSCTHIDHSFAFLVACLNWLRAC